MQTEIKFSGFGGQGILISAKILAYAAMKQNFHVAWVPSYGPEMRGGTAYCTVVISDQHIGSPIIKNPSHLIAMNRPSLEKFENDVKPGGIILINSSLVQIKTRRNDVTQMLVPANDWAIQIGSVKCANIVMLAAFAAKLNCLDLALLKNCVMDEFKPHPELAQLNRKAFDTGIGMINRPV